MMVDTGAPSAVAERVRELCRQFKLPTLAAETVGRFSEAGHLGCSRDPRGVDGAGGRGQAGQTCGPSEESVEAAGRQDLGHL